MCNLMEKSFNRATGKKYFLTMTSASTKTTPNKSKSIGRIQEDF